MWSSLIGIVLAAFLKCSIVYSQDVPNTTVPTPTAAPAPTDVTMAPTHAPSPHVVISRKECLVCKNTTLSIANPYGTIEFPGTGVFSCYELFVAGYIGLLNSTFCANVQERVVETCNCTPSYPPIPAPSVTAPTRPPVVSFPPYPTAGFPVCYTCQTPGAQVEYLAFGYSCTLNEHFGGFLDPDFCSLVNNDAKVCNCQSGSVPGFISVGFPTCYVCKDSSLAVGNPNLVLTLPAQLPASCLELQNAGLQGFLDSTQCPYFQDQVEQNCNCTLPPPVPPPVVLPTFAPLPPPTFPPVLFPFWLSPLYPPRPAPYFWPVVPPTFVTPVSAPPTYRNGGPTSTPSELGAPTTAPTSAAPVTSTPVVTPTLVPVLTVSAAPAKPTSPTLGQITPTSLPTLSPVFPTWARPTIPPVYYAFPLWHSPLYPPRPPPVRPVIPPVLLPVVPPVSPPPVSTPPTSKIGGPMPTSSELGRPTAAPKSAAPVIVPPSPSPSVRGSLILSPKKLARKGGMVKLSSGSGGAAGKGH